MVLLSPLFSVAGLIPRTSLADTDGPNLPVVCNTSDPIACPAISTCLYAAVVSPNRTDSYSGKPTFLRRAFTRGSPRSRAYSGNVSALPIRKGPAVAARSRASNVRSLSPKPAKISAWLNGFIEGVAAMSFFPRPPCAPPAHRHNQIRRESDYPLLRPDSRPFRGSGLLRRFSPGLIVP
jgi:hypothetical protein